MDCPQTKRSEVAVACPSDDALAEILSRLRAKPLFRFKCVSKSWCALITDHLRCRKFPQTLEGFFDGGRLGDFIDLLGRPVPLVDPSFSFLTKVPEIESIVLLGSCNGLVLFGHRRVSDTYDSLGYIVCNPATEQWVAVPSAGWAPLPPQEDNSDEEENQDGLKNGADTHLVFDPAVSPHFQLVQLWFGVLFDLEEVHTYSSENGAWGAYRSPLGEGLLQWGHVVTPMACTFNGMLHLVIHIPFENRFEIIAVDGKGKQSRVIHWPESYGNIAFVGQSQGHLHCVSSGPVKHRPRPITELSIWVLEDYDAEKWILRHNVSFSQVFGRKRCNLTSECGVVAIHPHHGLVFFVQYWNRKLISYDMDRKEVHVLCTLGHGCRGSITPYVPYFAESAALMKQH